MSKRMVPESPLYTSFTDRTLAALVLLLLSALVLGGCNRARDKYFNALEKVGIEKRELLVSRVDSARDAQADAQEEFQDALEQWQPFQAVVEFDGGDLEKMYKKLSRSYERSKEQAEEVRSRITKVERVARSLFSEWQSEITQYSDAALRSASERELRATEERYQRLVVVMRDAAKPMDPVLAKLRDQVLYLKHNLNARALGSLQGTVDSLKFDVDDLVRQMESSIKEADAFIDDMNSLNEST